MHPVRADQSNGGAAGRGLPWMEYGSRGTASRLTVDLLHDVLRGGGRSQQNGDDEGGRQRRQQRHAWSHRDRAAPGLGAPGGAWGRLGPRPRPPLCRCCAKSTRPSPAGHATRHVAGLGGRWSADSGFAMTSQNRCGGAPRPASRHRSARLSAVGLGEDGDRVGSGRHSSTSETCGAAERTRTLALGAAGRNTVVAQRHSGSGRSGPPAWLQAPGPAPYRPCPRHPRCHSPLGHSRPL